MWSESPGYRFHLSISADWQVNSMWTSTKVPPPPRLYSSHSASSILRIWESRSAVGQLFLGEGRVALLCHHHFKCLAPALLSPPLSQSSPRGANIAARCRGSPTPHELWMGKHARRLTGRQLWEAGLHKDVGRPLCLVAAACLRFRASGGKSCVGGVSMRAGGDGALDILLPRTAAECLTCERSLLLSSSRIRTLVSSCLM